MWADATQFRNSSSPFPSMELCKNSSKADAMVKDVQVVQRKLNNAGASILKEHLRLHPEDIHPKFHTLNALLEQVRIAQNNQEIPYNSISRWFQRQRQKLQKQVAQSTTASTPPTTAFNADVLHRLQTLIDATPNPSPDVLDVWASLFQVTRAMLDHAIHVILPEAASQDTKHSPTNAEQSALDRLDAGPHLQRLPTPASSLTPEPIPFKVLTSEVLQKECNIPTLVCSNATGPECGVVAPSQQPRNHTTMESISAPLVDQVAYSQTSYRYVLQLSPPLTPVVPCAQAKPRASETGKTFTITALFHMPLTRDAIISGIAETCADTIQNSQKDVLPPKNAAEFQALFAPYESRLEILSRMLDTTLENTAAGRSSDSRKSA